MARSFELDRSIGRKDMIRLKLPISTSIDEKDFVIRVERATTPTNRHTALLTDQNAVRTTLETRWGPISISCDPNECIEGDVLLVSCASSHAERLIRADSNDNTLLFTERCDQRCIMCSQPPKKTHADRFELLREAVLLSPKSKTIGVSGGEPTLYLEQLIEILRCGRIHRPDLSFHVLTHGRHLQNADLTGRIEIASPKVLWGIPIYSHDETTHDEIVVKNGAHQELCSNLSMMLTIGARVELRTVILKQNAPHLPRLAQFISNNLHWIQIWAIMQAEKIGFAERRWNDIFSDSSIDFHSISEALSVAMCRGVPARLYNFPRCTVPEFWRDQCEVTISDWKRRYLRICDDCTDADLCTGVFEWYDEANGFMEIHPL